MAEPARRDHVLLKTGVGFVVPADPVEELAEDLAPLILGPVLQVPRGGILLVGGVAGAFEVLDERRQRFLLVLHHRVQVLELVVVVQDDFFDRALRFRAGRAVPRAGSRFVR